MQKDEDIVFVELTRREAATLVIDCGLLNSYKPLDPNTPRSTARRKLSTALDKPHARMAALEKVAILCQAAVSSVSSGHINTNAQFITIAVPLTPFDNLVGALKELDALTAAQGAAQEGKG